MRSGWRRHGLVDSNALAALALAALLRFGATLRFDVVLSIGCASALRVALRHALLTTWMAPWASCCLLAFALQARAHAALLPQEVPEVPRPQEGSMADFRSAEVEPPVREWVRRRFGHMVGAPVIVGEVDLPVPAALGIH